MARFNVYSTQVQNIIGWVKSGEIAIPEIQRPFVWDSSKVRNLMDSLYKEFPIGYIIVWKNPDVKLKDGTVSIGKKILIDGQQRVTAMQAAIAGLEVINASYEKKRIVIAFNPLTETFEVSNPAIQKDTKWIQDIAEVFKPDFNLFKFTVEYCQQNGLTGQEMKVSETLSNLQKILNISLGITELDQSLSIDEVTDIFIRINSQGVVLSQADFAISKISSDEKYGGPEIRKLIDYFCHLMARPSDYELIMKNDTEFAESGLHQKIKWVVKEQEDIYVPDYTDILRVSFTHKFNRGKIADLVSKLSGRNFETKENLESIAEESFADLRSGVEAFVNETNFKRYLMILRSAGIVSSSLVRSQNVLNFGYILYLTLKEQQMDSVKIESIVRRWVVMTILTGRYSGSPESMFDYDIKRFTSQDPEEYVANTIAGVLSDAFWENILVERLNTSVSSSPLFHVFLMAQIHGNARGFLSKAIDVQSLIEQRGDVHHIFPKKYLQKNGLNNRRDYNQIANYVYTQQETNIKIKDKPPYEYMSTVQSQVSGGEVVYGGITDSDDLKMNLEESCIPGNLHELGVDDYQDFLQQRRKMMADYIKSYFEKLN